MTSPSPRTPYQRAATVPVEVLDDYQLERPQIERLGRGHINETFIVHSSAREPVLLQALNHDVFTEPLAVMSNLDTVLSHLETRARASNASASTDGPATPAGWRTLRLLRTREAEPWTYDRLGRLWRAFPFFADSGALMAPRDAADAGHTAFAFGVFQATLADLDPERLQPTIPRFHDTVYRFEQLDQAIERDTAGRVHACSPLIEEALTHRPLAPRLLDLQDSGGAPTRVVHNDAKIGNVLFDAALDAPICVVDLDTVMAGISLFDFGDMVRSMSHITREDERDLGRVVARPDLFEALATGFVAGAPGTLTRDEVEHLVDAGFVLVLEQGVRFLTDHLEGDHYFPAHRPGHNLQRARTQFRLLASLLEQENELRERAAP